MDTIIKGMPDWHNPLNGNFTELSNKIGNLSGAGLTETDLATAIKNDRTSLSEKANDAVIQSKVKLSSLYRTALEDMNVKYNLQNSSKAIKNGTLKIALVDNSIGEGANNYSDDVWCNRFIEMLKKNLPSVTIQFQNFSIGGATVSEFNSDTYVAVVGSTDVTQNFWRSWATAGKSWKQHVKDYSPDLLIVGFGMNDVNTTDGGLGFINNIGAVTSEIATFTGKTDIVLITTILPTEDKTVYPQDTAETLNMARLSREFAKNNGYGLIDANRLWRLLLYGVDDERFKVTTITDIATINQSSFRDFDVTVNINGDFPTVDKSCDMWFRKYNNNWFIIRFVKTTANMVQLWKIHNGNNTMIKEWSGTSSNTISVKGSKITVNGNTAQVVYENLYDGTMNFSALQPYIASISMNGRIPFSETAYYKQVELLGNVTNPFGFGLNGNGVNHPTSLGHYLSYYMASMALIGSLKLSSKIDNGAIVNNLSVTQEGFVLDARQGKILNDQLSSKVSAIQTSNTAINTLQTEGIYYIYNATDVPSGVSGTGYVEVHKFPQANIHLFQKFYPYNDASAFYLRKYNADVGWSSWYKYGGTVVS